MTAKQRAQAALRAKFAGTTDSKGYVLLPQESRLRKDIGKQLIDKAIIYGNSSALQRATSFEVAK
jgi:hypothetical protein